MSLNKSVILDSSVLIAFYLENDIFHFEAKRIIGSYEKRKYEIIIPFIVLIEFITVLTKKGVSISRTKKIIDYIKTTNTFEIFSINNEELLQLALKYANQNKLKSQDYIIFLHYAKLKTGNFESFDHILLQSIKL